MNVIINFRQCAIRFSTRPSDEVLRGLRAEGFTWHAPTYSWIRPEGWNGLPEDFCDWLGERGRPRAGRTGACARQLLGPLG